MFKLIKTDVEEDKDIIPISELKPLDFAEIVDKNHADYKTIVMRTASITNFEVMNISTPGEDSCWDIQTNTLKVKRLPKGTLITLQVT